MKPKVKVVRPSGQIVYDVSEVLQNYIKSKEVPTKVLKHEKDIWIRATRLRDQTGVPKGFVRIITCSGTVELCLKKFTKAR